MYKDRTVTTKLAELPKEELLAVAAEAMQHLMNLSYSKNNFSTETMGIMAKAGKVIPSRSRDVEKMHKDAYGFLLKF